MGHATMSAERGNDQLITVQKSLSNMAINCVERKFENNPQTAIKESLALFPMDELKAEQRLIIEKIVARRDVFGQ